MAKTLKATIGEMMDLFQQIKEITNKVAVVQSKMDAAMNLHHAALMEKDGVAEAEQRSKIHSLLDVLLDLKAEAHNVSVKG